MDTCFRKNTEIDRGNKAYVLKIAKKNFFMTDYFIKATNKSSNLFHKLFYLICVLFQKRFIVFESANAFHHSFWDFSRRYSWALDRCRYFSFFIVELTSVTSFSVVWMVTRVLKNLVHNKVVKTRLKLKLFALQ